jgi:hypothetical protein
MTAIGARASAEMVPALVMIITDIDVTAAEQVHTYFQQLRQRGITLALAKAQLPLREAVKRLGLEDALAEGNYFQKLSDAVSVYENSMLQSYLP